MSESLNNGVLSVGAKITIGFCNLIEKHWGLCQKEQTSGFMSVRINIGIFVKTVGGGGLRINEIKNIKPPRTCQFIRTDFGLIYSLHLYMENIGFFLNKMKIQTMFNDWKIILHCWIQSFWMLGLRRRLDPERPSWTRLKIAKTILLLVTGV